MSWVHIVLNGAYHSRSQALDQRRYKDWLEHGGTDRGLTNSLDRLTWKVRG